MTNSRKYRGRSLLGVLSHSAFVLDTESPNAVPAGLILLPQPPSGGLGLQACTTKLLTGILKHLSWVQQEGHQFEASLVYVLSSSMKFIECHVSKDHGPQ